MTGCAKLPDDGGNTKPAHYTDVNKVRYVELFIVGGNGITGNMLINVYNTITAPGFDPKTNKDSAPQAWVEGLNTEDMKKQFGALGAAINGPKLLMLDWIDLPNGVERDFNGQKVAWVVLLHLTKDEMKELGKFSYKPTTIERRSCCGLSTAS